MNHIFYLPFNRNLRLGLPTIVTKKFNKIPSIFCKEDLKHHKTPFFFSELKYPDLKCSSYVIRGIGFILDLFCYSDEGSLANLQVVFRVVTT